MKIEACSPLGGGEWKTTAGGIYHICEAVTPPGEENAG